MFYYELSIFLIFLLKNLQNKNKAINIVASKREKLTKSVGLVIF